MIRNHRRIYSHTNHLILTNTLTHYRKLKTIQLLATSSPKSFSPQTLPWNAAYIAPRGGDDNVKAVNLILWLRANVFYINWNTKAPIWCYTASNCSALDISMCRTCRCSSSIVLYWRHERWNVSNMSESRWICPWLSVCDFVARESKDVVHIYKPIVVDRRHKDRRQNNMARTGLNGV